MRWVEGRCLSYGTSIAYLLWLDVLRSLLGVTEEAAPSAVRDRLRERVRSLFPERFEQVYPYLGRLMSLSLEPEVEAAVCRAEGQSLKEATLQAVEMLVECAAKERPLVLVCEDLHWADSTSIELLERLLALTDRAPVLFVCVMRPERERPSWRIGETGRRLYPHRHVELSVAPLSEAESQTLVGNLLAVEGLPAALKERILQQAEGNPFYLEEILRSLIDTGAIARDETTGRWVATRDVAEIALPGTLQGVLLARIDRLQEDTKRVLQMASVIGRVFLYRVLAAVAEEEERLDRHLVTLQREEMIRERARIPELEYIFKHYLTQEAAYNGLLKKHRRVYHRQVAEALERLFPERRDELCGFLAYHWERAEVAEKAIEYLLKAGDQARVLYAHQEAVGFYERALVLLKRQGDVERATRTLMKLGLTYHTAFDYERSRAAYDEAFALRRQAEEGRTAVVPTALQTLRLAWVHSLLTLDPTMAIDESSGQVVAQMFSGLVALTPDLDVVPDVALGWEVSTDGRRYVFHLRHDVYWSDGTPLTAGDFEYAWKRVLNPAIGSPIASLLYDVKGARAFNQGEEPDASVVGVRAADDTTLVVELEEPAGYFLHLLSNNATYPLPRHVVEKYADHWTELDNIASNGPFCLESWEPGRSVALVRNPQYHGEFGGNVGRLHLALLRREDWRSAVSMYEKGDLDLLEILDTSVVNEVEQRRPGSRVLRSSWPRAWYLVFDVTRPPFDDQRVRRAFVLSTDRVALAGGGLVAGLLPATGGLTPPGMPGHCAGIALPHDPDRARALLAEAGYPGGRGFPPIQCLMHSGSVSVAACSYFQTLWRQDLGLDIPWEAMEWGDYLKRIGREPPHIYVGGWVADYPDPDTFLRVAIHRQKGWRSAPYEELVEQARRSMDQVERMRLYRQAENILADEVPILLVGYSGLVAVVQPWVTKFPTSRPSWKDVVIEPHEEPSPLRQGEATTTAVAPTALQTLRLAWRDPPTLDPSMAGDIASAEIIAQMFGGLVHLSPELDVLPNVARRWEVSTDGRRYVFDLRDDVRWSDGRPVTAGDFEYAWKRVLDPAVGSPNASLLYDVKGARAFNQGERPDAHEVGVGAADDRTLVVEIEEPAGYFLHLLSHNAAYPLPRHIVERYGEAWTAAANIVSNGPFCLETWEPGRSITLVRSPHYHGVFDGNVGRVQLALMPPEEWHAVLARYQMGDFDAMEMAGVPPSLVSDVQHRRPGSKALRFPRLSTFYLVLDVTRPPFDDPRVRQALLLGTDREAVAAGGLMSGVLPATGGLTPRGMPGHCEGIAPPHGPERARRLLAEAGYPDGRGFPEMYCLAMSGPALQAVSSYLQSQWRQNLGLEVSWETMEWGDAPERVRQERPHIYLTCWVTDYPDPDSFLRVSIDIHSAWRNETYESLVEQARHVMDQGERMRLYKEAERILAEEAPIIVVGYGEETILLQPWVRKFPISAAMESFWKDVVIEPHEEPAPRRQATHRGPAALPPAPHAFRIYEGYATGAPRTLDAALALDTFSWTAIARLFSGLVEQTPDMDIVPDVAQSWEVLEDGRRYLFRLRDDARWSDGVPVTAHDFEYSWKRCLHPGNQFGNASFLYDLRGARDFHQGVVSDSESVGVKALNDLTLSVELEEPTGHFLYLAAKLLPVPRHAVEARGKDWALPEHIVTNGPFRIETWDADHFLAFVRNPLYGGRFPGNVERVELHVNVEPARLLQMYEADQLDQFALLILPPQVVERVRQEHAAEVVSVNVHSSVYVGFNAMRVPFEDARVRRAFALATDRQAYADAVRPVYPQRPATGGFVPPGMPGHSPGIALPYDPARARELLSEAGYPGGRNFPPVKAFTNSHRVSTALATQWREHLEVSTAWQIFGIGAFPGEVGKQRPDIVVSVQIADYEDPHNFLADEKSRWGFWTQKDYDRLIEQARRTLDQGERIKLYKQADRILVEEAAIVPLCYGRSIFLRKPWVKGLGPDMIDYCGRDTIIEPH